MLEQEKQDLFVEALGRKRAERLHSIWKESYPKFCSIPYGEELPRNHTKEEVFRNLALSSGFTADQIDMFLAL